MQAQKTSKTSGLDQNQNQTNKKTTLIEENKKKGLNFFEVNYAEKPLLKWRKEGVSLISYSNPEEFLLLKVGEGGTLITKKKTQEFKAGGSKFLITKPFRFISRFNLHERSILVFCSISWNFFKDN